MTQQTLPYGYPESRRSKLRLNADWRFHLGDVPAAKADDYDDSTWEVVTIPHTLKLTSLNLDNSTDDKTQPTFHRDVGWYRRIFTVGEPDGRKVFLEFEGAHQVTDCWVNGQHVGTHAIGGYTPFHFDITTHVKPGEENVVALRVDNTKNPDVPPDPGPFDYIKFSGLYREVYLVQTDTLYIPFAWESRTAGVTITTPTVKEIAATISVQTTLRNDGEAARSCLLRTRVIDARGMVVLTMDETVDIPAKSEVLISQVNGLDDHVHLWSCDDPYLYRVNTLVLEGEQAVDCVENPLGIRKFELREDVGFLLNGKPLMLVGVNRHQHFPYVGDAVPKSLHRKDALQFKQAGFNVVRLAHYPHDNAFIEACDELGILVYEEAPTWIDFGGEVWIKNLVLAARRAIRNHRNHPCIFAWGGGINHRGTFEPLHYAAKEEDPTRWTGSNHAPWTGAQRSDVCDFYSNMDYRNIPAPNEPMFAVEHGISVDGERAQILVSRYKGDPKRFGMAAWTAHSYYTFHHQTGGQRNRTRGGMMDIFRTPRPVYFWYQSEMTTDPMVYIADAWKEGLTSLRVFSNCEQVELLVNGVSLGKRKPDTDVEKQHLDHPPFTFPVVWRAGEVEARAWNGDQVCATQVVRTPGAPVGLDVWVDLEGRQFTADGSDIVLAYARIVDANGTTVPDESQRVSFTIHGSAAIVGDASIGANPAECFHGIAPVLVRAGSEAGDITLTASMPGVKPASVTFQSVPGTTDAIVTEAKAIYDLPNVRVDIGGHGQHVQYGWLGWMGDTGEDTAFTVTAYADAQATLSTVADQQVWWRGEANVPGPRGFVAEDGVCAMDTLSLTFTGLAAGTYALKTYHHGPSSDTDPMDPLHNKEHAADISQMPSAICLDVDITDCKGLMHNVASFIPQSNGIFVPAPGPAYADFQFIADGASPVRVDFRSSNGQGSIWLNGFELQQQPPNA